MFYERPKTVALADFEIVASAIMRLGIGQPRARFSILPFGSDIPRIASYRIKASRKAWGFLSLWPQLLQHPLSKLFHS